MIPRSYASDGDDRQWQLFAREEEGALVFTAVVTEKDENVVAELLVDDDALKDHSEELGLEMETHEFKMLLLKALEQRVCVDVEVETEEESDAVQEVSLALTYTFSPTISRKGVFQLPIVAIDAPQSLVKLLASIHAAPPQSTLSERQKKEKRSQTTSSEDARDKKKSTGSSQGSNGIATSSQNSDSTATTAITVNPMLRKRRQVPTGTMRRKGPKGAKLAKK
ncbi:hypothetical protein PHYPSEUDO_013014 [Phytophthora pseudosyringae]|uniref:Uncharacterized protein n=1 Tax=Phytophthora pseudosyringae TaxID=221518 RepID=A0A8T1V8N6_9STRA|nr:hypothetical protein PHYPSEUDO_013014 [Phytophthora pseudosyringae]